MINDKYKYAYLGTGKCGSTSVGRVLSKMPDTKGGQHSILLAILKDSNKDRIPNDYFTFTFYRNPYARIVSAWQEFKKPWAFKWAKEEGYWDKDSFKLHGLSEKNTCEDFSAFVRYITIENHIHWCQLDLLRKSVKIDYIGKFETLQEDFNTICDKIGIPRQQLPHENKSNHKHYTEYYNEETKQIVAEKYAKDIEYLGYEFGK